MTLVYQLTLSEKIANLFNAR